MEITEVYWINANVTTSSVLSQKVNILPGSWLFKVSLMLLGSNLLAKYRPWPIGLTWQEKHKPGDKLCTQTRSHIYLLRHTCVCASFTLWICDLCCTSKNLTSYIPSIFNFTGPQRVKLSFSKEYEKIWLSEVSTDLKLLNLQLLFWVSSLQCHPCMCYCMLSNIANWLIPTISHFISRVQKALAWRFIWFSPITCHFPALFFFIVTIITIQAILPHFCSHKPLRFIQPQWLVSSQYFSTSRKLSVNCDCGKNKNKK